MSILRLLLKVGYDGSKVSAGLDSMDKEVQAKSQRMADRLKGKLMKAFVIGGAAAAFRGLEAVTFGAAKASQELASANDITIAQLVEIERLAGAAGKSFEAFATEIKNSGKSLKDFAAANVNESFGALAYEQNAKSLNRGGGVTAGFSRFIKWLGVNIAGNTRDFYSEKLFGNDTTSASMSGDPLVTGLLKAVHEHAQEPRGFDPRFASMRGRDFDTEHSALEISRRTLEPHVNSLQQVGLMGVSQNETVIELRNQIQVLRHIDGTLEKIKEEQRLNPEAVQLLP